MIRKNSSKRLGSKGFSHVELALLVVVIAVIAGVGFFVYSKNNNKSKADTAEVSLTPEQQAAAYAELDTVPAAESSSAPTAEAQQEIQSEAAKVPVSPYPESIRSVKASSASASGKIKFTNPYRVSYIGGSMYKQYGKMRFNYYISFKNPVPSLSNTTVFAQIKFDSGRKEAYLPLKYKNWTNQFHSKDLIVNSPDTIRVRYVQIKNMRVSYKDPNNQHTIGYQVLNTKNAPTCSDGALC
jgi:Tfp pilus assembly protein PilE